MSPFFNYVLFCIGIFEEIRLTILDHESKVSTLNTQKSVSTSELSKMALRSSVLFFLFQLIIVLTL